MAPNSEDLRICVEFHAYAWKTTLVTTWKSKHDTAQLRPSQSHAYAQDRTHMRGRQAYSQRRQGHAHAPEYSAYA
ncbi:hypothetical protein PIB30_106248, partial [Stylosanthes scabra]|nr:hypothetical protein [Stylosanthes scabra]